MNNNFNQLNNAPMKNFYHIKKFNSDGVLIDSWGIKGTNKGEFLHPHGIGSDSYGNIYLSDAIKCNIQKFDNKGNFLLEFGKRGNGPVEFL
jgi:tripartite motif-containing protein 71